MNAAEAWSPLGVGEERPNCLRKLRSNRQVGRTACSVGGREIDGWRSTDDQNARAPNHPPVTRRSTLSSMRSSISPNGASLDFNAAESLNSW